MRKILSKIFHWLIKLSILSNTVNYFIVKKYHKLNIENLKGEKIKTPWVCMNKFDIDTSVIYINQVYNDYIENSGLKTENLIGKEILEIGPGENFGVALKFLASGARKVVCVDKFNSLLDNEKQFKVYSNLLSQFTSEERDLLKDVISLNSENFSINENRLRFINNSVEQLVSYFEPQHFDFIISRAVLEHVYKIDEALKTMDVLLKKNGYMLHEVDFRDHGIFTNYNLHPLTMHEINEEKWNVMASNFGAPNRKMMGYYQTFFHKNNYNYDTIIVKLHITDEYLKLKQLSQKDISETLNLWINHRLTKRYWSNFESEMFIGAAFFSAQKQNLINVIP
ncbi:MAG: methyltransferase domain-containing protein [Candidatus Kapaibacterium sp.]